MIELIFSFSILIIVALVISLTIRFLKQPLIIAYIITGIVIALIPAYFSTNTEFFSLFSQFGITFLLFIVGLHLNPKILKEVGGISFIVGILQIIITAIVSFFLSIKLGFDIKTSFYIASALTFSSTILVTKILSDKQDLDSLYGKISVGILILQDFVVLIVLIFLPYIAKFISPSLISGKSILYILITLFLMLIFTIFALPRITRYVAKNQELLFLFSISWCFLFVSIFYKLGLGMEIGALIAGMTLSTSQYRVEISSKVKPLRDFFLIIFFISLGLQLSGVSFASIIKISLILSAFVIIFKSLLMLILFGLFGYTKRTGFLTGISISQISEFSFIIAAMGVSLNQISKEVFSIIILVGIITIFVSTYLMYYDYWLYNKLSRFLSIFERKNLKEKTKHKKDYDYILLGYNRTGFSLLKAFTKISKNFVVIDFNPEIVKKLSYEKINCIYGDAEDIEMLNEINMDKAKLIVSTIPDIDSTTLLIDTIKQKNKNAIIIVTARQIMEALKFYDLGADYVILPHFLGGQHTAEIIEKFKTDKKDYEIEKKNQIKELFERLEEGQEHPHVERGN